MGGNKRVGRGGARRWPSAISIAAVLMIVMSGCAERPPAPLAAVNGRSIVLGPEPGFDPAALPKDWFVAPSRTANAFKVVDLSGIPVLRIDGSGGPLLGRNISTPLLAAPYLHAGWYLDPALYGGGPRDGLPRGLRLVVGFKGGTPGGAQLIDHLFSGDLPSYDRFIELRLGGLGTTRAEEAQLELAAISDRGVRRVLHLEALAQRERAQPRHDDEERKEPQVDPLRRARRRERGFDVSHYLTPNRRSAARRKISRRLSGLAGRNSHESSAIDFGSSGAAPPPSRGGKKRAIAARGSSRRWSSMAT